MTIEAKPTTTGPHAWSIVDAECDAAAEQWARNEFTLLLEDGTTTTPLRITWGPKDAEAAQLDQQDRLAPESNRDNGQPAA